MFTITFDEKALTAFVQFDDIDLLLSPEVQGAMKEAGELLATTAEAITWQVFAHPTGKLAGTIHSFVDSPYEVQTGTDSPYGRRRERGFSGMRDSIGRFYPEDPAKPYLQPALLQKQQDISRLFDAAIAQRLQRLGG